jgi:hypothetical protein
MAVIKSLTGAYDGFEWVIDQPTEGQHWKKIKLDWTFVLGGKERISDPRHSTLRSDFQAFLRTALEEPGAGVSMEAGSLWATFAGITEIARFMWEQQLTTISQLTSQKSWEFVKHFRNGAYIQHSENKGRKREVTHSSAYKILHPLTQIHTLQLVLRRRGHASLPEAPYSGMSTYAVVTDYLKLKKAPPHKPIPDEVSIPTLSRAATWVMVGAKDVIRLQERVLQLLLGVEDPVKRMSAMKEARKEIAGFQFSEDPQTGRPWRSPITTRQRHMLDGRCVELTIIQSFRRLIQDMMSACIISMQGATGMRAHELIGLRAQYTDGGRLSCVESTLSADGLMEIFAFTGITAKRAEDQHRWTAGLRPVGSEAKPIPVLAVQVLEELLRPWRKMSGDDHLLLTFSTTKALPRGAGSIGWFTSDTLTRVQREFAADALVDNGVPWEKAKNLCFELRGQRWRTTFAHAVFRTSPKLLGALRDHFRHMSELITDQGYIGNDACLLEDLESERIQSTARTLLQISMGKKIGAGGIQRLINQYKDQLEYDIGQMSGNSGLERAESYVIVNDIRIWTGPYASCLINIMPASSRCNEHAPLSPGFARPDYANRSPGICAACHCCVILREHRDFWAKRHDENAKIVEQELASPLKSEMHSAAQKRVAQSRAILRSLDPVELLTYDVDPDAHV